MFIVEYFCLNSLLIFELSLFIKWDLSKFGGVHYFSFLPLWYCKDAALDLRIWRQDIHFLIQSSNDMTINLIKIHFNLWWSLILCNSHHYKCYIIPKSVPYWHKFWMLSGDFNVSLVHCVTKLSIMTLHTYFLYKSNGKPVTIEWQWLRHGTFRDSTYFYVYYLIPIYFHVCENLQSWRC